MKVKQLLSIIFLSTSLLAQGHMLRPDQNAVTVSFGYDRSLDFFGEGKLLRDSYNNSLNLSYIYNGFLGFDFSTSLLATRGSGSVYCHRTSASFESAFS